MLIILLGGYPIALLAPELADVTGNLPCCAQVHAQPLQGVALSIRRSSGQRAGFSGAARQGPGLAVDHFQIRGIGNYHLVLEFQVHVLPFAQTQTGRVQRPHGLQDALW